MKNLFTVQTSQVDIYTDPEIAGGSPVQVTDVFDGAAQYVSSFVDVNSASTLVSNTKLPFLIRDIRQNGINALISAQRINDIRKFDEYLAAVNEKLPDNGIFICFGEAKKQRKQRILNKFPKLVAYPYYYFIDFPVKRIFPKWEITRWLYFLLTNGRNKVMAIPEMLGRLIYSGFRIIDYKEINNQTYFVTEKVREPTRDVKPSYGFLFKMRRVGKDGKIINVYKIRTMCPFSEYLQKFVFEHNHLKEGGKFKDDFRITTWGKILRKFWLDELPMLFNWLKRDLKLVGLRPLSEQYLSLYSKDLVEKRLKIRPGLIPPYYSDMPKTLDEIMASEERYILSYLEHPIKTDIKYFFSALGNILLKGVRSS